jgi:phosphotransferase system enzyme I (PtsI)
MNTSTKQQFTIEGKRAAPGIAIGEAVVISSESKTVTPASIKQKEVADHKERFNEAKLSLVAQLEEMSIGLSDAATAGIIDTQSEIIKDPELEKSVFDIIENKLLSVDFAVYQTYCTFIEKLKESGSELFRQRIIDLEDIRDRFIAEVCDQKSVRSIKKGSVIIAREISPTDLVAFYEDGASGLVMEKGGTTAHAAIIAKSLGMPCIVNAKRASKEAVKGEQVILNADEGALILRPSKETLNGFKKRLKAQKVAAKKKCAEGFETKDGVPYKLLANIEFEAELNNVGENGAQGIGLLRTEGLLFGKRVRKSTEEQEAFYEQIVSGTEGPVTIRLFDIGGDKNARRPQKEANPFLGWRGIRLLLDEKKLLRSQLQAILTVAGKYPGKVKILVPMVSVIDEVRQIRNEIEKVQGALLSSGVDIDEEIPLGLMVEVPSVAISAYQFAREVDFMSIGSNDLTQYTLAVDRGNERIHTLFQHYHPSVLKLAEMTVKGARKADIEVSVCGELAGDEIGAACLFGLGIRELSMVPSSVSTINELLSSHSSEDFSRLANKAIELSSSEELEQFYEEWK